MTKTVIRAKHGTPFFTADQIERLAEVLREEEELRKVQEREKKSPTEASDAQKRRSLNFWG